MIIQINTDKNITGSDKLSAYLDNTTLAVTNQAGPTEHAINGALDKLKASLDTILGKLKTY